MRSRVSHISGNLSSNMYPFSLSPCSSNKCHKLKDHSNQYESSSSYLHKVLDQDKSEADMFVVELDMSVAESDMLAVESDMLVVLGMQVCSAWDSHHWLLFNEENLDVFKVHFIKA